MAGLLQSEESGRSGVLPRGHLRPNGLRHTELGCEWPAAILIGRCRQMQTAHLQLPAEVQLELCEGLRAAACAQECAMVLKIRQCDTPADEHVCSKREGAASVQKGRVQCLFKEGGGKGGFGSSRTSSSLWRGDRPWGDGRCPLRDFVELPPDGLEQWRSQFLTRHPNVPHTATTTTTSPGGHHCWWLQPPPTTANHRQLSSVERGGFFASPDEVGLLLLRADDGQQLLLQVPMR